MAKFIVRRFFLLLLTMFVVSVAVFVIVESSPGNIAKNILGAFITPEQEASFLAQMGFDKPMTTRYLYWLTGSDWHAQRKIKMPLTRITTETGFQEWWVREADGTLVRWTLDGDDLVADVRAKDGTITRKKDNQRWKTDKDGNLFFWGLDRANHAVLWEKGAGKEVWSFTAGSGWQKTTGGPIKIHSTEKRICPGRSRGFY